MPKGPGSETKLENKKKKERYRSYCTVQSNGRKQFRQEMHMQKNHTLQTEPQTPYGTPDPFSQEKKKHLKPNSFISRRQTKSKARWKEQKTKLPAVRDANATMQCWLMMLSGTSVLLRFVDCVLRKGEKAKSAEKKIRVEGRRRAVENKQRKNAASADGFVGCMYRAMTKSRT